MNAQEKAYASKRIKEISSGKHGAIRIEDRNEQNKVLNDLQSKQMTGAQAEAESRKRALKKVKPVFETMANIKKAVLDGIAKGQRSFPVTNMRTMMGRACDGWGYPDRSSKELSLIKNANEILREVEVQYREIHNGMEKERQVVLNKVKAKYVKRYEKLEQATQSAIDCIMLGESDEAVKAIAEFSKLTF